MVKNFTIIEHTADELLGVVSKPSVHTCGMGSYCSLLEKQENNTELEEHRESGN